MGARLRREAARGDRARLQRPVVSIGNLAVGGTGKTPLVAYVARLTRSGLVETLKQDYIRTARAKGLSEWRVVTVHALRGAILPVVSFSGPALAFLLTGTVVVERMFAIPGLGAYFIDAANNRDHFLILGLTAFAAIALMFANLLVDVTYALIDPRIRYE